MKPGEKVKLRADLPQYKVEEMMEIGIVPNREYHVTNVRWVDGVDFIRLNGRDLMVGAKWFVPVDNAKEVSTWDMVRPILEKMDEAIDKMPFGGTFKDWSMRDNVWDFTDPALCSKQQFREGNIFSTDEEWAESQKKWDRLEKFLDSEDAREFFNNFDFDDPKEPLVTLGKDQLIALMVAFKKATRHKDGRPLHVDPEE